MGIKLSHHYSTIILKVPFTWGFCKSETISRGMRSEDLSHFIAKVLGQTKLLFLITISSAWDKGKSGCPIPLISNV